MMPGFSAKAWREAHAPWTYTTSRGRTYAARPISTPRLIEYFGAIEHATASARIEQLSSILREAFPRLPSFAWRGDPVAEILKAPPLERKATLESFFASQGVTAPPPRIPTNSRASSSS